jgi:hypothetical protein
MQEPAYILKNGNNVPYIPIEVKTARDAYAASLHVLFKHVADFHICIVKTFSAKYGIPEDDILKTIQESEEFKNMHVDPVLDPDSETLGYLTSAPTQASVAQEPVSQASVAQEPMSQASVSQASVSQASVAQEPVKKRIVKKKTVESAPVPVPKEKQDPIPEYTPIPKKPQEQDPVPVPVPIPAAAEKKRVIKKKPVASLESLRTDTDITQSITTPAPPTTPALESITDVAKLLATTDATGGPIQKKIIKKKN